MGNGTFTLTKAYARGKYWTEAIVDGIRTELMAQFNTVIKNNFDQLKADIMPSTYTFDDDGAANLTNKIYDKQTATSIYQSNVSLGTSIDADFTNADATNLILTFTPEIAGKYLVRMAFPVEVVPTGGTQVTYQAHFRMQDNAGTPVSSNPTTVAMVLTANDAALIVPVTLEHIFTFTAASQTIKLQKRNITVNNLATHRVPGSASLYGFYAHAIKV